MPAGARVAPMSTAPCDARRQPWPCLLTLADGRSQFSRSPCSCAVSPRRSRRGVRAHSSHCFELALRSQPCEPLLAQQMAALASASAAGRKPRQGVVLLLLAAAAAGVLLAGALHRPAPVRPQQCHTKALLPLPHRDLFGQLLEQEGATAGAELGVQVRQAGWVLAGRGALHPRCCTRPLPSP